MKRKKVQIGVVGVDSGQLLVCDPCYILSEWKGEGTQRQLRYYSDRNGDKWACNYHVTISETETFGFNLFTDFETVFEDGIHKGKTPNMLVSSGEWVENQTPDVDEFSYSGCCSTTLSKQRGGQLNYKMGHAGVGVAFSSGYGDGCYPVFAEYNDDGRVIRVTIEMD